MENMAVTPGIARTISRPSSPRRSSSAPRAATVPRPTVSRTQRHPSTSKSDTRARTERSRENNKNGDPIMHTLTEPPPTTSRHPSLARWRPAAYWLATAAVVAELELGGAWDIARLPTVRDLVTGLGYPSYFLVLLGIWKLLGGLALLVPRRALLKEWAYAGTFFVYTGAIASHLTTGYARSEVALLAILTTLTVLSWALRPPSRRLRQATGP